MSKVIRQEKCICCEEGTVTFRMWDDENTLKIKGEPVVVGNCDKCDVCCGEQQVKSEWGKH
jgi:hypothetical protein